MIKKISFFISLMFILCTNANLNNNQANANMFNKFKKGFYFEKYKNAEEAKAALLELHPIGSNVNDLVKTLERSKATCYEIKDFVINSNGDIGSAKRCEYTQKGLILDNSWFIMAYHDKNFLITNITSGSGVK